MADPPPSMLCVRDCVAAVSVLFLTRKRRKMNRSVVDLKHKILHTTWEDSHVVQSTNPFNNKINFGEFGGAKHTSMALHWFKGLWNRKLMKKCILSIALNKKIGKRIKVVPIKWMVQFFQKNRNVTEQNKCDCHCEWLDCPHSKFGRPEPVLLFNLPNSVLNSVRI